MTSGYKRDLEKTAPRPGKVLSYDVIPGGRPDVKNTLMLKDPHMGWTERNVNVFGQGTWSIVSGKIQFAADVRANSAVDIPALGFRADWGEGAGVLESALILTKDWS